MTPSPTTATVSPALIGSSRCPCTQVASTCTIGAIEIVDVAVERDGRGSTGIGRSSRSPRPRRGRAIPRSCRCSCVPHGTAGTFRRTVRGPRGPSCRLGQTRATRVDQLADDLVPEDARIRNRDPTARDTEIGPAEPDRANLGSTHLPGSARHRGRARTSNTPGASRKAAFRDAPGDGKMLHDTRCLRAAVLL